MSSGLYTQPQFPSPQQPSPSAPQFGSSQYAPASRGGSGKFWLGVLMIGGGMALLFSVLVVAAVWYAVASLDGMLVGLGREGLVAMVHESDLPAGEKGEVVAQIDRVVAAYKAGEIDQADLSDLMTRLDESPVMIYIAWYGAEDFYMVECELPAADQARVRMAVRRAMLGMCQRRIDEDELYAALPDPERFDLAIQDSPEAGAAVLMKSVERMERLADEAGIPSDVPEVDIGDEAKKLVDELLAKG
jgi:hypothetical protein